MMSSRRYTNRPRPRNHGAHPVTFPSVTQAYIDPRAYAAAGDQRNPLSTIDVRPRNTFTIHVNNCFGNANVFQRTPSTPRDSGEAYAPCPQETPFANSRHRQSGAPQRRPFRYHVRPDAIRISHPDLHANLAFRAPRIITSTTRATADTRPAHRDHVHAMSSVRSSRPTATISNQTKNDAPTHAEKANTTAEKQHYEQASSPSPP